MIDLREKGLPSRIEWEGGSAEVKTDFRTWIRFDAYAKENKAWRGIFANEQPKGGKWVAAAIRFLESPNVTPRQTGNDTMALDYVLDGDYIVAAFQQAYGIDLTSCDMHWHRFKALMAGLPDCTKLSSIMHYRTWKPDKRKQEELMAEQRAVWSLPAGEEEDDGMGGFGALIASLG